MGNEISVPWFRWHGTRNNCFCEIGRKEMIYLTTHLTHFIYSYMASDIWLRTILILRKETCFRHIGYSFRLAARVLLYAPSHRQDSKYHGLCYTRLEQEIAQWVHPMKDRSDDPSHHEWTLLPRSYISLLCEIIRLSTCRPYIQCVYFGFVPGPRAVICWGGVQFPPLLNCTRCCPVRRGGCQNYNQRPQQTKRRNLTISHQMMTAEKKSWNALLCGGKKMFYLTMHSTHFI